MDLVYQDSDGDLLPFVLDALNEVCFYFLPISHFFFVEMHILAWTIYLDALV